MTVDFPTLIPAFYQRLLTGKPDDPLAKMVVFDEREKVILPNESADPIGDHVDEVAPNLIHRYPTKVLLLLHSECAGHCRYCFSYTGCTKV